MSAIALTGAGCLLLTLNRILPVITVPVMMPTNSGPLFSVDDCVGDVGKDQHFSPANRIEQYDFCLGIFANSQSIISSLSSKTSASASATLFPFVELHDPHIGFRFKKECMQLLENSFSTFAQTKIE